MKIAVFGAAGWLGRAVLANLSGTHEVRAVDRGPEAWETWQDVEGAWREGEIVHADIADFESVHYCTEGCDAVIHLAVYFPKDDANDPKPFLVNLKGLWNVLESARQRGIRRVVHMGSCQAVHPRGVFFSADVRRPDGSLYAVCKRLQEEMCRQVHEAHGLSIIVLRPASIVDSRLGIDMRRQPLGPPARATHTGWVCRHDLAEACRLAAEHETLDFDILHIAGTPEADATCNVARSRDVLGLVYKGDLERYRESPE